jgi:hypothetical protein
VSALTEPQKRDALILHAQGDTPEAIARHLGVEVKNLPAAIRRKAEPVELEQAEPDEEPPDDDPGDDGDED